MKFEIVVHEAEEGGFWAEVTGHSGLRYAGRQHG
jgi:predicted RNase H-like HicB family nuclease